MKNQIMTVFMIMGLMISMVQCSSTVNSKNSKDGSSEFFNEGENVTNKQDGGAEKNGDANQNSRENTYQECETNDDCKEHDRGSQCLESENGKHCGCSLNDHCPGETECILTLTSQTKVCLKPCKSDQDCSQDKDGSVVDPTRAPNQNLKCNTTTGLCVLCLSDEDCKEKGTPKCEKSSGRCVQCLNNDHCTGENALFGSKCYSKRGKCGCESNNECASSTKGKKCLGDDDYKFCGCSSKNDCKTEEICISVINDEHGLCDSPCKNDADCKNSKFNYNSRGHKCDTGTGICQVCLKDEDCKDEQVKCIKSNEFFRCQSGESDDNHPHPAPQ